ncbi:Calcium/calmodulin-dependent/calcium-dependent protein kinase [Parasponia andersonii]|uniref:non-specific serine/threonine protein kinase n=1 Tax=Parasponia andersonii TaxID=3476 RepID=A0A2P5AUJ2_PARAD|nr:Calcium/calmodulin-dependent/calcium-dependent protein kinase [Parasponia andersonii]
MEARVPQPPPPPPFPATTVLGKYRLGRELGRGSFARVFEAQSIINDENNSKVAIKIIKREKLDAAMEPRIIGEVEAMRRLHQHPNVLKIHEVMATKTKIYLVMELATGGELFAKVAGGRKLKESAARRYFQQLVSALRFCHQNGVAHRDVKPQNLLLDRNGSLKVSDFGLSALPDRIRNGLLHTACGTLAYTAPEVLARRGYDGSKADAWSCGVILHVLVTGQLPFDDRNQAAMNNKIRNRDYRFPDSVSVPAQKIIYRLLDPNPKTRLTIEKLAEISWFKKSLPPPPPDKSLFESSSADICASFCKSGEILGTINAFDIIASLSSGLNLSGLFEGSAPNRREKRFTAAETAEVVIGKVSEVGDVLGFRSERGKGWSLGLGKGRVVLIVEVFEISPSLFLGEMKVVEGGFEFEELHWQTFKSGLERIGLAWINDNV